MFESREFWKIKSQIDESLIFFNRVENDQEMNKDFVDKYTTSQQKRRDIKITRLLSEYVEAYAYKNKSNRWYKNVLMLVCVGAIISFVVVFIMLIMNYGDIKQNGLETSVVELISICITFLTLIIGILTIITKYVFPKNEEEYITRIVEIIQKNDLEHKKENIRVKAGIHRKYEEEIDVKELAD